MLVSVVTPTLNAARYIEECLRSVKLQESPDVTVEHVIMDGGSTDSTMELAQAYGATVFQGKDSGIFDAINKGTFKSSGELVGFLGADDVLLPGGLEAIVRGYNRSNKPAWVVGAGRWIDADGESLGDIAAPPNWMTSAMHASLNWCCIQHVSTYITRDLFEKLGGFDLRYKGAAEYDLFCRALKDTKFARVPEVVACFRRTGENYSMARRDLTEIDDIESKYAPRAKARRTAYRYIAKLWVNGANPGWTARKFGGRIHSILSAGKPQTR